jgi:O-antigen ligase
MALLGYMLVSTIWSDITFIALRRWVREVIVVIMALVIMSEAVPLRALESVLRRFAYVLLPFSFVVIKYYPILGVDYGRWSGIKMWRGVAVEKNNFGCLCAIGAFFLLWALYRQWRERASTSGRYQGWADISVLLLALFLLSGADKNSATAATTLAVGCVAFLALRVLRKLKVMIPQAVLLSLVISVIGFGVAAPFLGGSNVATFSSSLGRDESLTGRTEIWAQMVPVVERQLLIGNGFGSFWTTARREFYQNSDGHNGYLDVLLDLGTVGLAFYSAWLLSCARKLHRVFARDYTWASMAICCLLMALVYNVTESTLSGLAHQMTALTVLVSLVVPYDPAKVRRLRPQPQGAGLERSPLGESADEIASLAQADFHRDPRTIFCL